MSDFLKNGGFSLAAVVQIVLIVLSATVIFTTVRADVDHLKAAMDQKINADLVDSKFDNIDAKFDNIEANIALIQQDIRQIRDDLAALSK